MKKQKKDPNGLSVQRAKLRAELEENAVKNEAEVLQHKPWTYIKVRSWYTPKDSFPETQDVTLWGVSKICWPDKWDAGKGVETAFQRSIAWAVKAIIPPHDVMTPKRKEELAKLQREFA